MLLTALMVTYRCTVLIPTGSNGNSEAIDDDLVLETVERLPDVQAAWLALYNFAAPAEAPCVWESDRKRLKKT